MFFLEENPDRDFAGTDKTGSNILRHLSRFLVKQASEFPFFCAHGNPEFTSEKIERPDINIKDLLNQKSQDNLNPVNVATC